MRIVVPKISFSLAAVAALFHSQLLGVVDGAIGFDIDVKCLPEAPQLCISEQTVWSPFPAVICPEDLDSSESCAPGYLGGWGWEYVFAEGLEEGTTDLDAIEIAKIKTGMIVTVSIEDDMSTCEIVVGDEDTCRMCSAEGCTTKSGGSPKSVKYDCTNLENGRASLETCAPLELFLYPFNYESESTKTAGSSNTVDGIGSMEVSAASPANCCFALSMAMIAMLAGIRSL